MSPDFLRLAGAVRLLEEHRSRVHRLTERAARLATFDVIVVAGEEAVLERLGLALDDCQRLLIDMSGESDGAAALDRLEQLVRQPFWDVLADVQRELDEKDDIAVRAGAEVETKLATWSGIASRVAAASQQIESRRLRVAEPRQLSLSRRRMMALVRQANASFKENRLLDVWRAINDLESVPPASASLRPPVPPREVPGQLTALIKRASPGPLQLTVLRGPVEDDQIEYTLMLLTPTGDQYVGINVQDTSTIGRQNYERFVREADQAGRDGYRALRDAAVPHAQAARPADDDHLARLRDMGHILYRLVVPTGMREVIERHPAAPLVVITNDRALSWELMFADDFVALQRPLARMPVGRAGPRRTLPAEPTARRRVALVGSAGSEPFLAAVESEVRLIAEGLSRSWPDEVDVDVFVTGTDNPADGANFERVLIAGDYDIIHYAGHATFDEKLPDRSGLLLDDAEQCSAEKIQRLVSGTPLVFLNACETARIVAERPSIAEGRYEGDPREGLASAFLYGGALACIGNSWPVPDTIAADFAVAFYSQALEGLPLGEAMRVARREVHDRYPQDPSWASFVYYGDPGFSLDAFDTVSPPRTVD